MVVPLIAIAIFVAVFGLATARKAHLGILMIPAACGTGVWLAGMPLREVVGGFPVGILVLLVGVTYFFGLAQVNGTVDRVIAAVLARTGPSPTALPVVFFGLAAVASAMGSPQAGLVLAPIGMPVARRAGVDALLMAIALNSGISAGAFAPTSLFGIVTYRIARQAGIGLNPFTLLAVACAANLVLLGVALLLFRRSTSASAARSAGTLPSYAAVVAAPGEAAPRGRLEFGQVATMVCLAGLVMSVIACALLGVEPDIGVTALAFGAVLTVIDPTLGPKAFARIDWSSALVVGGIVTFVGVLQHLGAVDLLGQAALRVGTPMASAVVVCMIAALVSAFASTTGVLAALVPLAVPLAASGEVAGWALIAALGVCATIVDASPFSNTGATLIASAADEERPRLRSGLLRWGMAMVVVGPVLLVPVLVLLSRW
jgi:di/tricarboxylate transporter